MEISDNIIIETERFYLRRILESDVQVMFELDSDPIVHKYLGNHPVHTIEESAKIIQHIHRQYRENGLGRLAIIDKENNAFVGWTGLKLEKEVRPDRNYYDIGYRMHQRYWGKGIATETTLACMEYGFKQMKLPAIYGAAVIENEASKNVLQKIGLHYIDDFVCDGEDCKFYGITQEDWLKENA